MVRQVFLYNKYILFFLISLISANAFAEAINDVRVVIDVSGSMKKNDPNNLRAPALRLLVGLMPNGTRSGVWTFGKYVNMQVVLGTVDDSWKNLARAEADKIHSRGQYTNIEEAIVRATDGWDTPDPRYRRHLIILTDGMVDVSEDDTEDFESRRRILQEILPRLENADVMIHTIALSDNVDFELLFALAGATKGTFEKVQNADQLQRIFLRIFENAVKPDTLPIEGNKFTVDKHVEDITVLVFLAKDSPPTSLVSPSGKQWDRKQHGDSIRWHHEDGYDLITIKKPEQGEWNLVAKVDPDNRVMIVTNLKLKTDRIDNILMYGDRLIVKARLLEDGKTVTNADLLSQTSFEVKQIDTDDHVNSHEMLDSGNVPDVIKGDGIYSFEIERFAKPGTYDIVVQARSVTFKREKVHTLQVYDSPANIEIKQAASDKPFIINIAPHAGLIRPETVSMQVTIEGQEPVIVNQVDDLQWSIEVAPEHAGKNFVLTLAGTRYTDQDVKMDFEQVLAVTQESQSLAVKIELPEKPAEPEPEPKPETTDNAQDENADTEHDGDSTADEQDGFSWSVVIGIIVALNVLLFGGGYIGYRIWKKKKAKTDEAEKAELTV